MVGFAPEIPPVPYQTSEVSLISAQQDKFTQEQSHGHDFTIGYIGC